MTDADDIFSDTRLVYSSDSQPGIRRVPRGDKFSYLDPKGEPITDPKTLDRIASLGIPPAWQDVWISPKVYGHIQATGKDEKGRKQYRYHDEWIAKMQEQKFEHMVFFSDVLPTIREHIAADMRIRNLDQRRVLATIVWLLENTYIRVGNEVYARENKHFGLTTLRSRHVSIEGNTIKFSFVGKSGKEHEVDVEHPRVVRTIRQLEELPGYELFQYVDDNGKRQPVTSQAVNDYLKTIAGEDVTAKDFRTWGGTVLAAATLEQIGPFKSKTESKRNISQAVKVVSQQLRNTPAVCRSYYIHPVVPQTYVKKRLIPFFTEFRETHPQDTETFSVDEQAVAALLKDNATA